MLSTKKIVSRAYFFLLKIPTSVAKSYWYCKYAVSCSVHYILNYLTGITINHNLPNKRTLYTSDCSNHAAVTTWTLGDDIVDLRIGINTSKRESVLNT